MSPIPRAGLIPAAVAIVVWVAFVITSRLGNGPAVELPLPSAEPAATVLLAVGDIGSCDGTNDDEVARLVGRLPGTIALLGDIAYLDGSASDFANCFHPAWGPLLPRIRPAAGNHEYQTTDATGYFAEFGASAGTPGEGWYSYELGAWHVVVLNSNCTFVGGCDEGSPQLTWLEADLEAHPSACTLAYWHHPRYSSGLHEDAVMTEPLWHALAVADADLVLSGHDHDYERVAPIDRMRSFVVGTGGRSLYDFDHPAGPRTELRANDSYGVLMLTLGEAGFDWRFVPTAGGTLVDSGSATCH